METASASVQVTSLQKKLWHITTFFAVLLLIYTVCILVFPRIKVGGNTLMKLASRNPVAPGGMGFSLQRFEEIESCKNVDIVFLGSSHAYRTYDTRIYGEAGYPAFNMGSTGQTPLNSYFLLKRYWEQLQPKLVILDLVYRVIDRDGLESFYDLSSNMSYSKEFLQMALEIHSPYAINYSLGMWTSQLLEPDPSLPAQKPQENQEYVPGGYVRFVKWHNDSLDSDKITQRHVTPEPGQLRFIRKIIRFARKRGAKVLLVTKPEPRENLAACANYDEISQRFAKLAAEEKVSFWDFNVEMQPLDKYTHFHDIEYLSTPGVEIYNNELIRRLRKFGLL